MSSDWRARLGTLAAGLGLNRLSDDFSDVAEGSETSGEATTQSSRLRKLLDDLKAADPNGTPAVEPEPAKVTAFAPVLNGERKAEAMSDDAFLLVAEQRKAAEALLLQVAELEQRLQTEAHAAQAAADYTAAKEKAEAAAIIEQQANDVARAALARHAALVAERQEADNRAKELAAREAAAQREAAEAAAGVTACQSARAQAEKDAEEAQQRAQALTREIAELSARIAQQAADVKRSREAIATAK